MDTSDKDMKSIAKKGFIIFITLALIFSPFVVYL